MGTHDSTRTQVTTVIVAAALLGAGCAAQEDSAPTFQITSPSIETTSTLPPLTLEYLGVPELNADEEAMCTFVQSAGRDLISTDERSRIALRAAENAAKDRNLSEPIRVRLMRDAAIADAQRFTNVLVRFQQAEAIIAKLEPGELTDRATLDRDAADAALLTDIGRKLTETIDEVRPLNATEQAEYEASNGTKWVDILTEEELDAILVKLNNDRTGMGRETEARDAMERLDDWSWRHCSAGLTR